MFRHDNPDVSVIMGFSAVRGAPQGDGPSPLILTAILDILPQALTIAHKRQIELVDVTSIGTGRPPLSGENEKTYRVRNLAISDDRCTPAQTPMEQQVKAEIIAAFCAIFRIELDADKNALLQHPCRH